LKGVFAEMALDELSRASFRRLFGWKMFQAGYYAYMRPSIHLLGASVCSEVRFSRCAMEMN